MEPKIDKPLTIESMPEEIRILIVSKVGSRSPKDYYNTLLSCKSLSFSYMNNVVGKSLSLSNFVQKPVLANRYKSLVQSCLTDNNLDAHFVKGMLEFFQTENQTLGLHHINIAAANGHQQGRYVYGVLLIALGETEKGVKIINALTDEKGISVVEDCMSDFQRSVQPPLRHMKDVYLASIRNMWPEQNCHPEEGGQTTVCSKCFHFFLLIEFYKAMIGFSDLLE